MPKLSRAKEARASLLSLPNELLLQLLCEPNSLQAEWQKRDLRVEWYTWFLEPCARFTVPWSKEHHPIAIVLSQTCRRLRELMLPRIWEDIGLNTLEDLSRAKDGLRLFPERAELVRRLEWSWSTKHPTFEDWSYYSKHAQFEHMDLRFQPLEVILRPPFRWPKQPLATPKECVEAITEVICRLTNLDTLLWTSPYLRMDSKVVDFFASKEVRLRALQIDLGGFAGTVAAIRPDFTPYWKLAGKLEKLSIEFSPECEENEWKVSDMKRWRAYDDELVGLEEYCKEEVRLDEEWQQEQGQAADREETPEAKLSRYMFSERQMAVAYKTLYDACENGVLMSLAVHPFWVFSTPHLAPYWIRVEEFHSVREYLIPFYEQGHWLALKDKAHLGRDAFPSFVLDWYTDRAHWHLAAAAIRPALYHLARHRKDSGPLTGEDIQTLAERPPVYPASLFYPCFKKLWVAQSMAALWEDLVDDGESERVACECAECRTR